MFGWPKKRKEKSTTEIFLSITGPLVALQLFPTFKQPKDAFPALMKSGPAAGYLFGMHDALLQHCQVVDASNKDVGIELMKVSYQNLFGVQAGFALMSMSMHLQNDAEFSKGRMSGGADIMEYIKNKTPPEGLGRILVLGMSE